MATNYPPPIQSSSYKEYLPVTFWTPELISKFSNLKSAFLTQNDGKQILGLLSHA